MIPTVDSIILSSDKVLLVKHKGSFGHIEGKVGFPSGQVTTETPLQTLIIKLQKETGILVDEKDVFQLPFEYEAEIERTDGTTKKFRMKTFLVEIGKNTPKETDENVPIWVSISELDRYNLLPNVKKAILDALDYIENSS